MESRVQICARRDSPQMVDVDRITGHFSQETASCVGTITYLSLQGVILERLPDRCY